MQLDWFTLVAEIVNFLILVWLLKRFLYDRILAIADQREEEIAQRYEAAAEKEEDAAAKQSRYEEKEAKLAEKREMLLQEAREAARERRQELLDQARAEVEEQKTQWLDTLRRSQDDFLRQLSRQTSRHVYEAARRLLRDLADADLEHQVVQVFNAKMESLPPAEQKEIVASLEKKEDRQVSVRTAFPLATADRDAIADTFRQTFSEAADFQFRQDEELVCGVALRVNGRQLAWHIDSYLQALTERTADSLRSKWESEMTPEPTAAKEEADEQ